MHMCWQIQFLKTKVTLWKGRSNKMYARMRALLVTVFIPLVAMTVAVLPSNAADDNWGPGIGTSLPIELQHLDQEGVLQSFESLLGSRGMAVFFVRSVDWCSYCKRQMIELNERVADFRDAGVNVVSISYDSVEILDSFSSEFQISFHMLSDPTSEIINAFDIRDEMYEPGTSGYGVPRPGVFVIDTDGVIAAKFHEKSYKERPKLDDVLAALKLL